MQRFKMVLPRFVSIFFFYIIYQINFCDSYESLSSRSFRLYSSPHDIQSSDRVTNAWIPNFGLSSEKLKNLKTAGTSAVKDDALFQSWKEFKGLSEQELIRNAALSSEQERRADALQLAYRRCEFVTQLFSKTFYTGTTLMKSEVRKHVWAIYAWCRRTDDIVDSPRALLNKETLTRDLQVWDERLANIWQGTAIDLFDLALVDTVQMYPELSIEPFRDMIAGMVMDVPGLGQDRYETFDELYLYCYRVAGTVGLMTLPIFGTAPGYSAEDARESAIALGIGFQLTNILRDVGEDLERGRIYLPRDEIAAFGLTEEDIFNCEVTPKYKKFIKFQIQRARDYYRIAEEGVPMLAPEARFAVQASLDLYSRILNVIERNQYDNFRKRAFTTKFEKLSILPQSLLKTWKAPIPSTSTNKVMVK
jgi:15-cis-phytoene synthase